MATMKKIFFSVMAILFLMSAEAQDNSDSKKKRKEEKRERINAIIRQEEEGVITYEKHFAVGFKLTNDGYGGFIEIGRASSIRKSMLYQLEITERKNHKEEKLESLIYGGTSPFIFGKINYFYPIKIGAQFQYLLGNKGNKNGVSLSANAGGGFVLGLLRPYLVEVEKNPGEFQYVGYNSPDSAFFLNPNSIAGGPNLGTGWSNMEVVPGAYVKTGLRFDYGKYNEMISALEVGITGEFYSKKVPQMIYIEQKQFFLSAYVTLMFGRRK
jgi:hypothetical protein